MQMIQFQINHRRAFSLIQAKVNFKNNTKNKKEEKKEKENTSSVELFKFQEWMNQQASETPEPVLIKHKISITTTEKKKVTEFG